MLINVFNKLSSRYTLLKKTMLSGECRAIQVSDNGLFVAITGKCLVEKCFLPTERCHTLHSTRNLPVKLFHGMVDVNWPTRSWTSSCVVNWNCALNRVSQFQQNYKGTVANLPYVWNIGSPKSVQQNKAKETIWIFLFSIRKCLTAF